MTREEILNLEPGPELDRLVAEQVMGWREGKDFGVGEHGLVRFIVEGPKYFELTTIKAWSPSTDIAAAWEVVGCLISKSFNVEVWNTVELNPKEEWQTAWAADIRSTQHGACTYRAQAPSAPLAICRAALLATLKTSHSETRKEV